MKKESVKRLVVGIVAFYLVSWSTMNMNKLTKEIAGLGERVAITTQQRDNAEEMVRQWKEQYRELLLEHAELLEELKGYKDAEFDQLAWHDAGTFTVTHYCHCYKCCGKSDGITATGAMVEEGRTIAVDPEIIPLGSEVLIGGHVYIAEDTGVKGNHIDIYTPSHEQALQMGKYTTNIMWR